MATETQTQAPRIVRGRTELWVPHNVGEIAFAHPETGPDTYRNVGKAILQNGQRVPTGEKKASLLHAAYCFPEVNSKPEFENVRNIMRKRWLWVYNVMTWTDEGVYSMEDVKANGRNDKTTVAQLEKMLKGGRELSWGGIRFSRDGRVGFAPKGSYELGEMTAEALSKDGQVVIVYGERGAEKLGEVSEKFRYNPKTWGVNVQEGQSPEKRVSAVDGCGGDGLGVSGDSWGDDGGSYAFGVF